MNSDFPKAFTLDSGTEVVINQQGNGEYVFSLTPADGPARQFSYRQGVHTKAEWDEIADFEQLEALRRFWLETEDLV